MKAASRRGSLIVMVVMGTSHTMIMAGMAGAQSVIGNCGKTAVIVAWPVYEQTKP